MKGYIPIFTHMALISLVFSFFLPRQSWGEDPGALPQKGVPIVVRGDGAGPDRKAAARAGRLGPVQDSERALQGSEERARLLIDAQRILNRTSTSTLPTLQGGEAPTRRPAAPTGPSGRPELAGAETDEETLGQATASLLKLFLATLLLLLFMLVSVVLLILLRRRRVASRERPEPTVLEDLWTKTEE